MIQENIQGKKKRENWSNTICYTSEKKETEEKERLEK